MVWFQTRIYSQGFLIVRIFSLMDYKKSTFKRQPAVTVFFCFFFFHLFAACKIGNIAPISTVQGQGAVWLRSQVHPLPWLPLTCGFIFSLFFSSTPQFHRYAYFVTLCFLFLCCVYISSPFDPGVLQRSGMMEWLQIHIWGAL